MVCVVLEAGGIEHRQRHRRVEVRYGKRLQFAADLILARRACNLGGEGEAVDRGGRDAALLDVARQDTRIGIGRRTEAFGGGAAEVSDAVTRSGS